MYAAASALGCPYVPELNPDAGAETGEHHSVALVIETGGWRAVEAILKCDADDPAVELWLASSDAGSLWFEVMSLFSEDTYLGRVNGLRPDLVRALAGLKPKFLRFPGGRTLAGALDEAIFMTCVESTMRSGEAPPAINTEGRIDASRAAPEVLAPAPEFSPRPWPAPPCIDAPATRS